MPLPAGGARERDMGACPNGVRHHHVNVLKPDPNRRG